MYKKVFKKEDIRSKINEAIDFIAKPVISTLSPKGTNVMIQADNGSRVLTNDGVTIARSLSSSDEMIDTIVDVIKEAALRTNSEAGDGTTTTILLTSVLTKEALKLVDEGHSWIEIRNALNGFADTMIAKLDKQKIAVKGDKGLREIAITSANNDKVIAEFVIEAIKVAREEGLIFIEPNPNPLKTEIIKDLGFMIKSGVMYQELLLNNGTNQVSFADVPVLITDKKLYYAQEAETILSTAIKAGYKNVVVVARDFMGEALNTFIATHNKGAIKVMLVKSPDITDTDNPVLYDLAVYIGAKVFTDKTGSLVNKLSAKDFIVVTKAFSDPAKTLFTPKVSASKELKERIKMLRAEFDKDKDNNVIKSRLASLTTGVVTIKVGGNTPIEVREKGFRYEDAINAVRAALKNGYLPGGGTAVLRAFNAKDYPSEFVPIFKKYAEAIVRQIAINCGKHPDSVVDSILSVRSISYGYNALTDKYGDLLKDGVIDPFQVIKMAILNSVSVANSLISINYYVINEPDDKEADA